jgi:hypothetical protein
MCRLDFLESCGDFVFAAWIAIWVVLQGCNLELAMSSRGRLNRVKIAYRVS